MAQSHLNSPCFFPTDHHSFSTMVLSEQARRNWFVLVLVSIGLRWKGSLGGILDLLNRRPSLVAAGRVGPAYVDVDSDRAPSVASFHNSNSHSLPYPSSLLLLTGAWRPCTGRSPSGSSPSCTRTTTCPPRTSTCSPTSNWPTGIGSVEPATGCSTGNNSTAAATTIRASPVRRSRMH